MEPPRIDTVKSFSHRASVELMVAHALLITTVCLFLVVSLPTIG